MVPRYTDSKLENLRSFQCNWAKNIQTFVSIPIRPVFVPKRCCSRSVKDERERMVRPWVELERDQYRELETPKKKTGRSVSEVIREAVSNFVAKINIPLTLVPHIFQG